MGTSWYLESDLKPLTKKQVEVVRLLSEGNTADEVAYYHCRSLGTVRKHIQQAKQRTGAKTIAHLVKLAMQKGFIECRCGNDTK